MSRSPSCEKKVVRLKKGPWTPEEDQKLVAYIQQHGGHGSWRALPSKTGLERCGKSCRLRWINYLRPDIKRGKFSLQEERTIIQLHAFLGNKWSAIAAQLPKRTDNEIKNYWNTHLKKRFNRMGIDPTTHKPKTHALGSTGSSHSHLSHVAQWESARLEADARLVRESKLQLGSTSFPSAQPARLVIRKISPPPLQNSWSSPATAKDKNTRMHDMYALMLEAGADDSGLLELPPPTTAAFSFSEPGENVLIPPATLVNSTASFPAVVADNEPWRGSTGERRKTNLEDDDIMVAVEAFMSVRCNATHGSTTFIQQY